MDTVGGIPWLGDGLCYIVWKSKCPSVSLWRAVDCSKVTERDTSCPLGVSPYRSIALYAAYLTHQSGDFSPVITHCDRALPSLYFCIVIHVESRDQGPPHTRGFPNAG